MRAARTGDVWSFISAVTHLTLRCAGAGLGAAVRLTPARSREKEFRQDWGGGAGAGGTAGVMGAIGTDWLISHSHLRGIKDQEA